MVFREVIRLELGARLHVGSDGLTNRPDFSENLPPAKKYAYLLQISVANELNIRHTCSCSPRHKAAKLVRSVKLGSVMYSG